MHAGQPPTKHHQPFLSIMNRHFPELFRKGPSVSWDTKAGDATSNGTLYFQLCPKPVAHGAKSDRLQWFYHVLSLMLLVHDD